MIHGRCECGGIQYDISGEILDFSHCHCSQCRRLHGAAFATFAGIRRDSFRYVTGQAELGTYASSATSDRVFCKTCGSNILVDYKPEADMLYVCMGTVDDSTVDDSTPDGDPPHPTAYHQFVGSRAPWHEITDNLEQHDLWPPE